MDFFGIFACIASLCSIIMGVIFHYGKFNKYLIGCHKFFGNKENNFSKEDLDKISRRYKNMFFCAAFTWLTGLFAFHYFDIYHHFNTFFMLTMAIFSFVSAWLGLYTSWMFEKTKKRNRNSG